MFTLKFNQDTGATSGSAAGGASPSTAMVGSTEPTPQAAPAATTPTPSDWTTGFDDTKKGYIQNKGFKDPGMLLDSYVNLEKLVGASPDKIIKLGDNVNDPNFQKEAFTKLGMPAEAKDYKLDVPAEGGDPKLAEWAKGAFHEANLTQSQAEKVMAKWNELQKGTLESNQRELNIKTEGEINGLKKEWGSAYDQNVKVTQQAAKTLGIDQAQADKLISAMGFTDAMKMLNKVGSMVGEGNFHSGNGKGFSSQTPESAKAELASLQADKGFMSKYTSGDSEAKARMGKIMAAAFPGEFSL